MLGDRLSAPPGFGGSPCCPSHDGCPGFTSESLTGQQGEKVNPLDLSP